MPCFNLVEESLSLRDNTYDIPDELQVRSARPAEVDSAIDKAVDSVAGSSECIVDDFDTFRSFLKHANHLSPVQLSKILDALVSAFQSEIEATIRDGQDLGDLAPYRGHKEVLEMYAFLLMWFIQAAERYVNSNKCSTEEDAPTAAASKKKGGRGKAAKVKSVDGLNWEENIPTVLAVFARALRIKTDRIWQTTQERDSFIG